MITPIYLHEYTLSHMFDKERMGIQQIVITTVSESKESASIEAVEQAIRMMDKDLNISHRILLEGYKNE